MNRIILILTRAMVVFAALTLVAARSNTLAQEPTPGEQPVITVTASTDRVHVAEPFSVEVTITAPLGTRIQLPVVGRQLGEFDVIDHQDLFDIPSRDNAQQRTWTRRMTLESIVTGDLEIPALEVQVAHGSDSQLVRSQPVAIHVISVLEGQADPDRVRDIHGVVNVDLPQPASTGWMGWLAGAGGALVIAVASVLFVARRRTWLTPSQWALDELDRLSQSQPFESTDSEMVSQQLSDILRNYLELQFEISAPVQTSQELLGVVESRQCIDSGTATRFVRLFEHVDLAKFAGVLMTPSEMDSAISEARQLVAETRQSAAAGSDLKGSS